MGVLSWIYRRLFAPTCPFCSGRSSLKFAAHDSNQRTSPDKFSYYKCSNCGLVFLHEIPDDLSKYYRNEQYDIPTDPRHFFHERVEGQRWKIDYLASYVSSGSLLEIGPATGEFACLARDSGFDVTLIEMDEGCSEFLRSSLGFKVITDSDPAKSMPTGEIFDAIVMWQVVEHVPRFWEFISIAAARLRVGGVLVLSTPNPTSFQGKLLQSRWPHIDAPRHLYLIPPDWYSKGNRPWSLAIRNITTNDIGSTGLNYYGWYLFYRNMLGRWGSDSTKHKLAARTTSFARRIEGKEGWGCSYIIVLEKVDSVG